MFTAFHINSFCIEMTMNKNLIKGGLRFDHLSIDTC